LKSTGGAAGVTAKHVQNLAGDLSKVSAVDDEVIQSGANMLLTFKNIQGQRFDQAVTAALDLSAGFAAASGSSINMKSGTIQLGKALNDPIAGMSALTRVGVQFSDQQEKQITRLTESGKLHKAQGIILQEVTSQFAGSAQAQATATGTMRVALENLAETIGKSLAPAMTFLADLFTDVVGFLQENVGPAFDAFKEGIMNAWDAIRPFAEAIGSVLIPLFQTMWHTIQNRILPVLERLKPLFIVIGAAIAVMATIILAQFALVVTAIGFVIDKFLDLVGFIRDKVVEPIGNFLARIGDFIGKIAGWIKDRFIAAWQAVKEPVLAVLDAIVGAIKDLIGWIKEAINWLGQLGQGVSDALAERGAAEGVFSGIRLPGAQHGGIVTRSGLAMVHKGEAFSGVNNEMGFGGINGDIVLQVDGQTFARITRDQLRKLGNRNAGTGL
jgi:hypothetical protein